MNSKQKFCVNDRGRKKHGNNSRKQRRIILHIDMDAFFASIEQAHHPHLKGKPVIIGGPPESRGVVSTCSYEARKYGVHSAMSSAMAKKLCPDGEFIQTSTGKYTHVSLEIMKILSDFSPQVEPFSIDEAFLDITKTTLRYDGKKQLALEIKRRIWNSQKLTASIGIAAVRFVAKMATGVNKPDGLTIIEPGHEKEFLWPQPIRNLWGVGPQSEKAFLKIGIKTIADLAKFPKHRLKKYFGIVGDSLRDMANGIGEDEINPTECRREDKSMGHEHTFETDVINPNRINGMLLYLCEKVSRRLRNAGYKCRTITLKIKYSDMKLITRANTIQRPIDCDEVIYQIARYILEKNRFIERPIRLIGVSVSKLEKRIDDIQPDLLANPDGKMLIINRVVDRLKDKYGDHSISRAGTKLMF
ncbi:MAG: DNA polymerase IV [candidate division Zixibacteria bacterium]|nr:DNA polymerase IV [candidate division Zixibacteria bacterium]